MTVPVRALPSGERGLLLETSGPQAVPGLDRAIAELADRADLPVPVDRVPGARTVLLVFADPSGPARWREAVPDLVAAIAAGATAAGGAAGDTGSEHVIEVRYDGDDLDAVAAHTGLSPAEVVRAHTGQRWRCVFGGFASGFGYLLGQDERLRVPRHREPRAAIPAGAVGLADVWSGIYPRRSPGGWQLIGRTDTTLFDADRTPPALIAPGDTVRFVAIDGPG